MKDIKTTIKSEKITKWHLLDAQGKILGSLASDIADILNGKIDPSYTPNMVNFDKVVVINASQVVVTGNKLTNKVYYRHTGYPGGVKSETLGKLMNRRPTEALRRAVYGMLPKNKLRKDKIANLYIYEGSEHPHAGQLAK